MVEPQNPIPGSVILEECSKGEEGIQIIETNSGVTKVDCPFISWSATDSLWCIKGGVANGPCTAIRDADEQQELTNQ